MKKLLPDGRTILASFDDLKEYFNIHKVVGKTIRRIVPSSYDYKISNLREIVRDIETEMVDCSISTDESVCLEFSDGDSVEILIPGSSPIILGWNMFFDRKHDDYYLNCDCFDLNEMFEQCLNHGIVKVTFDYRNEKMIFPAYMGVDLSEDDDLINSINFILDNNLILTFSGSVDWCNISLTDLNGNDIYVSVKKLFDSIDSLNKQCVPEEFEYLKFDIKKLVDFTTSNIEKEYILEFYNNMDNMLFGNLHDSYIISINDRNNDSYDYVQISLEDSCLTITFGGSVYSEEVGSDSFSCQIYAVYSDGSYEGNYYEAHNRIFSLLNCGAVLMIDNFYDFIYDNEDNDKVVSQQSIIPDKPIQSTITTMINPQIERITKMEAILDESVEIARDVAEVLERFSAIQDKINELSRYYGSSEWFSDFDDSNSGKLPDGIKCGVLSEDSIYDLLAENRALAIEMLEVATKILK